MPELVQCRDDDSYQLENTTELNSCTGDEFWSKHRDAVSYNQLQKFWNGLSVEERQELLKIDKQMLLEQARKSMYCSRCNGLLLEGFSQIIVYGKSSNHEVAHDLCMTSVCENDDVQDPSIHPWGGLTTTRDGLLTLSEIYLCSNSLKAIQNVFESARGRERERELLYPDACGGGGRGWISHGRGGHATRETCALHNATLSVDTLVDFWSALGDDTKLSLLTMKEEDFIQSLIYRFENKRFCRDCRRNVIREFKELKELKRIRKEPRCTKWFCGSDTAFQYEITDDTVQADWHDTFIDTFNTYQYFEWAIGSREEKFDIMELKNVGLSQKVQVSGLELNGLNSCYITLKAHKKNGHSSEFSVKAHALKGKECVHCKLVVGDGFVSMTRCENIKRFFEHAEEAEEEEDDESLDKDGNELDSECLRPQKHAKSPELAREFLLDAAIVIFKEQVEKAFREGTARQNAHSMFVCLALKLLEDRVHVACKEIITYEKQMKLLEEEEKEKREEEERKERKRNKEREKKLRKKERLREKEKDKDVKGNEVNLHPMVINVSKEENLILDMDEDSLDHSDETPDMKDEDDLNLLNNLESSQELKNEKEFERHRFNKHYNENFESLRSSNNGSYKQIRSYNANSKMRNNGPKFGEKFNSNSRSHHPCSCKNQQTEYRAKRESITYHGKSKSKNIITRKVWEPMEKKQNSDATLKTNNFEITETNQKVVTKSEEIEAVKTLGDEESELNYSSCLSEGSSNPQIESSFTSDSEDSSQNDTLEKKQSEQFTKQIVDSSGTVKTEANIDHERVKTGNVGQILLPPPLLHNQGLHFPMYQAPPPPNYGYIHHQTNSPVSWVGPNYGVTHPNHGYVVPGNFNYGYNGNVFMQYGLTPPPPVFNHHGGVLPVYNQTMIPPPPPPPNQVVPGPGPRDEERVESKKMENDGFSLFHFGGPIGGLNFDSVCLKEGMIVVDDNKKNCIEEYNLFGASKGIESCLLSFDI